jgi:hypothetical protein
MFSIEILNSSRKAGLFQVIVEQLGLSHGLVQGKPGHVVLDVQNQLVFLKQTCIALKAECDTNHQGLKALAVVICCPGPGSSWGNLADLPASKYAGSPSIFMVIGSLLYRQKHLVTVGLPLLLY